MKKFFDFNEHKKSFRKSSLSRAALSFDWISFLFTLALLSIGVLFVLSSTYTIEQPFSGFFKKQMLGAGVGIILYCFFCIIDYRIVLQVGYACYWLLLALLFFTLIIGDSAKGGRRWVNLGLIRFQPSELVRFFFPAYATHYLYATYNLAPQKISTFIPLLALLALSFILVAKQPDLGTALLFTIPGIIFLWIAGLPHRFFLICGLLGLFSVPIGWMLLKPYQKKRIMVFMGQGEQHKERYQLEQSLIAIGSGKVTGKGFLQGTQNKFLFLPEGRNDFIFAVIAEEGGFVVATLVILLFLLLFLRILYLAYSIEAHNGQLLVLGLLLPLLCAVFINVGMVMGLLPVVGVPLPLVSCGISHVLVAMSSLGIIQGIIAQTT